MQLRPYQNAALDALFEHWENEGGHALIDMATGLGKSVVIAELCRRLLERWPSLRLLMLAPSRELVAQNAAELIRLWRAAPVGINSASLGRRDTRSQILFATVNSIYRNPAAIGPRDLIIGDECHLWPKTGDGMYRKLLAGMQAIAPDLRILGLSATCYRLDSGLLHKGKDALFDKVVYAYGIKEGVADGYLSPLISKPTEAKIDLSSVHIRGGEFIAGELEDASMMNVREAVAEMVALGRDRRAWLAFCAGVKHAHAVCAEIQKHGISCAAVTGDMPAGERDSIIRAYKAGNIRCLTNVNVLTTGFNVPQVDMLAMLRATLSCGLYVQMAGRGTRLADGKEDCLVLDFAGVVRTHGPVDAISISDRDKNDAKVKPDQVRAKECPQCEALIAIQCRTCPHCAYAYPAPEKPKHEARADSQAVIMASITPPQWVVVGNVDYARHPGRNKPDSMRVTYTCGLKTYDEWVPFESEKGRFLAEKWWRKHAGYHSPTPLTVAEALDRLEDLTWPREIAVKPDGKYWRVAAHKLPVLEREVA